MKNEVCPRCGSKDFGVARDMIGTRHCSCGCTWLPNDKIVVDATNSTITINLVNTHLTNAFQCLCALVKHQFDSEKLEKLTHFQLIRKTKLYG